MKGIRSLPILAAVVSSGGDLPDFFATAVIAAANGTVPCFLDREELKTAVDKYIAEDCADNSTCAVGEAYGWPMNAWCVSNVTDMSDMFLEAEEFNEDISGWDVSRVTDMNGMFREARAFEGNVSEWNVSQVTDMSGMFWDARAFNGDVSAWDISRVADISNLFKRAASFNAPLSTWDVSKVTDMDSVFQRAVVFNSDLSAWDVARVTDMSKMFQRALAFNGDLTAWDVSRVTNMGGIFYEATSFHGQGVSSWNVSKTGEPCSPCDFAAFCFSEACAFRDKTGEWSDPMAHCNFGAAYCEFCFTDSSCYGFGIDYVLDKGGESAKSLSTEHPLAVVTEEDQFLNNQSAEAEASLEAEILVEDDEQVVKPSAETETLQRENYGSAGEIAGSNGKTKDHNDGIVGNQQSEEDFDSSIGSVLVATSGLVLALLGIIWTQ